MKDDERLLAVAGLLAVLLVAPGTVGASETTSYHCDAAQQQAIVGAFKAPKVSAFLDYNDGVCAFSINGAPAGSPPVDQILAGFNAIDSGQMSGLLASGDVSLLAVVMIAAAPVSSAPSDLVGLLQRFAGDASKCFEALENQAVIGDVIAADEFLCRVAVPTGEPFGLLAATQAERKGLLVVGQRPQLQLAAAIEKNEYYLLVPIPSQ